MASAAAHENSYMFAHGTRCTARPRLTTPAACNPKPMNVASTAKRPPISARTESPAIVGSASSCAVRVSTETPDEPTETVVCSPAAAEAPATAASERPLGAVREERERIGDQRQRDEQIAVVREVFVDHADAPVRGVDLRCCLS